MVTGVDMKVSAGPKQKSWFFVFVELGNGDGQTDLCGCTSTSSGECECLMRAWSERL